MSKAVVHRSAKIVASPFETAVKPLTDFDRLAMIDQGKKLDSNLQRLLDKVKNEAWQEGRRLGYDQGYEAGHAEGFETGLMEAARQEERVIHELVHEAERVAGNMSGAVRDWTHMAEERLAAMAVVIAERLVASELRLGRENIAAITQEALDEVGHSESVRIRLNPFDVGILEARREAILHAASQVRQIEIVGDNSIEAGCVIESDAGIVDARVEAALNRLAECALGVRRANG